MSQSDERELALNEFTQLIRERLKHSSNYAFRSVIIDGVLCYPVIYKHRKIVNFECINIDCELTNKWGDKTKEKYSVYYKKYVSIRDAILTVELVSKCYRIYNGDLISPQEYKMAKMEERFLPYNESQVCCVCYENTLDTTVCDHYLCLRCREVCIKKHVNDCPMCRNPGVVSIYNIDNGLINNNVYGVLREVLDFERKRAAPVNDFVSPSSSTNRIFAFIDRIGNRRVRTPSSESNESGVSQSEQREQSLELLSEVSTIDENDLGEDSDDFIPFDLSVLFEAAAQSEPLTI
jgi:hypothetical protein